MISLEFFPPSYSLEILQYSFTELQGQSDIRIWREFYWLPFHYLKIRIYIFKFIQEIIQTRIYTINIFIRTIVSIKTPGGRGVI